MLNTTSKISLFCVALSLSTGCMEQSQDANLSQESLMEKDYGRPTVASIRLVSGKLQIEGDQLASIKQLTLRDAAEETPLVISEHNSRTVLASASRSLNLVAGKLYHLLIKSARADDAIPIMISVEVPPGHFDTTVLKGTGAGVGTVLKWNGAKWAPAPDFIGIGSRHDGLMFMGFTQTYSGALGGLKGANAKCEQEFPGSHWASVDEIMKLGATYPWTYPVWVRTLHGRDATFHNVTNDGYPMGLRTDSCYGWTRTTHNWTGTPLSSATSHTAGSSLGADGHESTVSCTATLRLACVQ
jgi:hypothetical protein